MKKAKGKVSWIPMNLVDEMQEIKDAEGLFSDVEALRKIAGYSKRGRR